MRYSSPVSSDSRSRQSALSVRALFFGVAIAFTLGCALGFSAPALAQNKTKSRSDDKKTESKTPVEQRVVLVFAPDMPTPPGKADELSDAIVDVIQGRLAATHE